MFSRRRLFSTSRTIQRRELPRWFGSPWVPQASDRTPIWPWNLVARTTSSRLPLGQRLADDDLRLALRVDVGGVDEVDAGVQGGVDAS